MTQRQTGSGRPDDQATGRRLWAAALLGGVIASALSWAAGEASVDRFQARQVNPLTEPADMPGIIRVVVKNAALAHGLQGALLGLTLGLAGGASRRPARVAGSAGLTGLVIGGGLGAAGSFGLFTAFHALANANSPELIPSLLTHASLAALLGVAGGLAFGLGSGGRGQAARAAIGGLLGAALGAGLYEVVGAVMFPVDKTGEPVAASSAARFLWHVLVDPLAALGAVAVTESSGAKSAATPDPSPTAL